MLTLHQIDEIDGPREQVWDTFAIPENEFQWDPKGPIWMEKLTDGPLAEGTRYRGKWHMLGKLEWVYGEFERPRIVVHDGMAAGMRMVHTLTFEDGAHGGTRFVQRADVTLPSWMKPLTPALRPVLQRRLRHIGSSLKSYVEGQRAADEGAVAG
ncbi:SRPBCC family protein [Naasia sp. SYSU D00057]|uniref:SRPBCC family protein n=1 Tax=Naasia sp. SYSU D00057 TaxID=2817380 RepID=UPI001B312442|nr:SRPBCC family protein [Naasia sp. SYSU D00057]